MQEVPGSISCWNDFLTNMDNPSFDVYSLGYLSVFFTVHISFGNFVLFILAAMRVFISFLFFLILEFWLRWCFHSNSPFSKTCRFPKQLHLWVLGSVRFVCLYCSCKVFLFKGTLWSVGRPQRPGGERLSNYSPRLPPLVDKCRASG